MTTVIAVLALTTRDRRPLPSFVATLPAVAFPGAIVAMVVALYSVSSRYRSWWLLAGCWPTAAGIGTFPLLGRFLHARLVGTDLTVTVTNTPPAQPTSALPGARHGLVGLRERAALLGGKHDTGSLSNGGFRLRLRLPIMTVGMAHG